MHEDNHSPGNALAPAPRCTWQTNCRGHDRRRTRFGSVAKFFKLIRKEGFLGVITFFRAVFPAKLG